MLLTHVAAADLSLLRNLYGQPAMSRAFGRLRSRFRDDLLIRREGRLRGQAVAKALST